MNDENHKSETTKVVFAKEARQKLYLGLEKAASAVGCTLGPRGKTVLIQNGSSAPIVTKDGYTVAKYVNLKNPIERMGAELVKQASSQTNELAGDGTTTSTVLTHAMVKEGLRCLEANIPAVKLIEGINYAVDAITHQLKSDAIAIDDYDTLKNIAAISANNDQSIGTLIADAMVKVGRDGIVTVEDAKGMATSLDVVEGLQFERGYLSPYFVTNNDKMHASYADAKVLVTDKKISQINQIIPILEKVHRTSQPLLIIAEDVEGEALQTLALNRVKSQLAVVAVKSPGYGNHKKDLLDDMCVLTGAQLVSSITGLSLEDVQISHLGNVKKVIVDAKSTTIVGTGSTKSAVEKRIDEIRSLLQDVTSTPDDLAKCKIRIARLSSGVAVIRVGGATEVEMIERKYRIEDALNATRAALEEGVVPGGGVALLRASRTLETQKDRDIQAGVEIILRAVEAPLRKIVENAGGVPDVILRDFMKKRNPTAGFNALTCQFVDMFDDGVIDPVKVSRLALHHAASVAKTFINLDAVISEDVND